MSLKINSHTNTNLSTSSLLSALAFPAVVAVNIVERLQARRDLNRLLSMPDYQLHDIGLQRHDILKGATEPLWWRSQH